ncbi:hypothetical protein [Brumimicrobium aurantiacum]|uniref:Uncharacterized protein n=1 Tax=Brumimicrobium aurantiacum TaxID=1737063 RepID=A0A3E1EV46_9FLAO|nr:hypothetical protein [Brumimicrobium aurantiacum]RFC53353.1 hypothetical protein DXU93_13045 [Brumimicrobium aurantiacum]
MKNAILIFVLIILGSSLSFCQEATHREVKCDSKEIQFYNVVDFKYFPRDYTKIPKREGVNSYQDLTAKEIKMLKKMAKKSKSCFVECNFNYQTPKSMKNVDQAKEDEKKKYFHFYCGRRTVKIVN